MLDYADLDRLAEAARAGAGEGGGAAVREHAVRVDRLTDIELDIPGVILRLERRWWPDGTSCLHIAKWSRQPNTGRLTPWHQPQYVQVPWQLAETLGATIVEAAVMAAR